MKFYKKGKKNPGILDNEIEISPFRILSTEILPKLDFFIGRLRAHSADQFDKIQEKLISSFEGKIEQDSIDDFSIVLLDLLSGYDELIRHKAFSKPFINYYIQLLKLPNDFTWGSQKAKIKIRDYYRATLLPNYIFLATLTSTIGRQSAISFYKQTETSFAKQVEMESMDYHGVESIERQWRKLYIEEGKANSTEATFGLISEGKFAYRIENCLLAESIADLQDAELKFIVCCYKDFENAKLFYDENIVLTLEHTIAGGDEYCSGVLHDTLVDWDIRHPNKEFWDKMGE